MWTIRTPYLVFAVIAVSVVVLAVTELRMLGSISLQMARTVSQVAAAANLALSLAGWFTSHRIVWAIYCILSVAALVVLSYATPITAVVGLSRLLMS